MDSNATDIFPVFPTPMHKNLMKLKLKTAQKGHDILKRKAEVLEMRFKKVGKKIVEIKKHMGDIFKEASLMLAEAKFVSGGFNQFVLSGVDKARLKVKTRRENVAGVNLHIFEFLNEGGENYDLTGLAKGGAKFTSIKKTYTNAVEILVDLATLQTTFLTLDDVIKGLNKRVNSLEKMYIPKVERTIAYISGEMEERERQDFFRMKKIQDIKKKELKKRQKPKDTSDENDREQK